MLLVYEDPDLLNPDESGLRRLETISEQCQQVAGVRDVLSLDRLKIPKSMWGWLLTTNVETVDVLEPDNPLGPRMLAAFENYTHASDGRTAVVICMLDQEPGESRQDTIQGLRKVAEGLSPGMLAGEPVLIADAFRYVQDDGKRLGVAQCFLKFTG